MILHSVLIIMRLQTTDALSFEYKNNFFLIRLKNIARISTK